MRRNIAAITIAAAAAITGAGPVVAACASPAYAAVTAGTDWHGMPYHTAPVAAGTVTHHFG